MRSIYNVDLKELLPASLLQDENMRALCNSINSELRLLMADSDEVKASYSVSEANEEVLTHIAWMLNSDLYYIGNNLEQKKRFVENAIMLHRKKGTKYALLESLRIILPNVDISEWFEYDGQPYHFRIENVPTASLKTISDIVFLINTMKNLRSWLDNDFQAEENNELILLEGLFGSISLSTVIDMRKNKTAGQVIYVTPVFRMEVSLNV